MRILVNKDDFVDEDVPKVALKFAVLNYNCGLSTPALALNDQFERRHAFFAVHMQEIDAICDLAQIQ